MSDDHVSRILKMLEEGKISASEAEKLLAAVRVGARPNGAPPPPHSSAPPPPHPGAPPPPPPPPPPVEETTKSFEFRWGQRSSFPFDFSALSKQISDAVKRIDPERILKEARTGGKRWQDRMKLWGRFWEDAEEPPQNTLGLPTARESEVRTFALPGNTLVQVENNVGAVVVQGGGEGVTLEIEREAWAVTQAEAEALLRQIKVECSSAGEVLSSPGVAETPGEAPPPGPGVAPRLEVRVTAPDGWRNGVANLRLHVPQGAELRLATTFGEIAVADAAGPVEVHSISGSLRLENVSGEVRADTVSGEVVAQQISGPVSINGNSGDICVKDVSRGVTVAAVSGDVQVTRAEGGSVRARSVSGDVTAEQIGQQAPIDISVESVSGDVVLTSARGNVALKTVSGDATGRGLDATTLQATAISGDLHLELTQPFNGTLTTTTVSGDVVIELPNGSNFRFTLDTQSGDLSLDHAATNETRTDSLWTGTVGTGAGTLSVKTLSGDIRLGCSA